eukprot:m51a1_g2683 hypothetical protein (281) ;mRNA; f:745855-747442
MLVFAEWKNREVQGRRLMSKLLTFFLGRQPPSGPTRGQNAPDLPLLDPEALRMVFARLAPCDMARAALVCRAWACAASSLAPRLDFCSALITFDNARGRLACVTPLQQESGDVRVSVLLRCPPSPSVRVVPIDASVYRSRKPTAAAAQRDAVRTQGLTVLFVGTDDGLVETTCVQIEDNLAVTALCPAWDCAYVGTSHAYVYKVDFAAESATLLNSQTRQRSAIECFAQSPSGKVLAVDNILYEKYGFVIDTAHNDSCEKVSLGKGVYLHTQLAHCSTMV